MKAFALVIAFLVAGSIFASAEVDDRSLADLKVPGNCICSAGKSSLIDMGAKSVAARASTPFDRGSGKSKIWIIDPYCQKRLLDLSLPLGCCALLELDPGTSGYAMLFHRLPSGGLQTRYLGFIYSGHRYRLPLCADSPGSHEIWYRVGWQESNRALMDVLGRR
jgi:hypothetical protein